MNCLINGQAITSLAVSNRAIHYGDGLFETIAVKHGVMPFWVQHYQRLSHGCTRLKLPILDEALLLREIDAVKHGQDKAVIKIILTRQGERGYPIGKMPATRIIHCYPYPEIPQTYYQQGVNVRFSHIGVSENSALAGIKHLNRLDSVLASSESNDPTIAESLMCNAQNQVIQGTKSNIFAVKANTLYTPSLDHAGVLGIMRQQVLTWAQQQAIATQVTTLTRDALLAMDELFLTNSIFGIWPVTRLDEQDFTFGKLTRMLMDDFK